MARQRPVGSRQTPADLHKPARRRRAVVIY
jgi:hypothetical protein